MWVCLNKCVWKRSLTKALMVAHFQSCLDVSASLDPVSVRTKPLWSGLYEVSIRLPFCYCPLVRSRACVDVRAGCLCPLPSGLRPVTHVLPIQVTNALREGGGSLFTVATQISTSNPQLVSTRAHLAANGPIDLDPPQLPPGRHNADMLLTSLSSR